MFEYEIYFRSRTGDPLISRGATRSRREAIKQARALTGELLKFGGGEVKVAARKLMAGGFLHPYVQATIWKWMERSEGGYGFQLAGSYWQWEKPIRLGRRAYLDAIDQS